MIRFEASSLLITWALDPGALRRFDMLALGYRSFRSSDTFRGAVILQPMNGLTNS